MGPERVLKVCGSYVVKGFEMLKHLTQKGLERLQHCTSFTVQEAMLPAARFCL